MPKEAAGVVEELKSLVTRVQGGDYQVYEIIVQHAEADVRGGFPLLSFCSYDLNRCVKSRISI